MHWARTNIFFFGVADRKTYVGIYIEVLIIVNKAMFQYLYLKSSAVIYFGNMVFVLVVFCCLIASVDGVIKLLICICVNVCRVMRVYIQTMIYYFVKPSENL